MSELFRLSEHDPDCATHVMLVSGLSAQQEKLLCQVHTAEVHQGYFRKKTLSQKWTRVQTGMFMTGSIWSDKVTTMAAKCLVRQLAPEASVVVARVLSFEPTPCGSEIFVRAGHTAQTPSISD